MAKKKKGSKKPNVAAAGAVESMPTIEDLAKEAKKGQASVIRKLNNFITTHPDQALDAIREVLSEAKNAPKNKESIKKSALSVLGNNINLIFSSDHEESNLKVLEISTVDGETEFVKNVIEAIAKSIDPEKDPTDLLDKAMKDTLSFAAENGRSEIVRFLLNGLRTKHEDTYSLETKFTKSAFEKAVDSLDTNINGFLEIIYMMMDNGNVTADEVVDYCTKSGKTELIEGLCSRTLSATGGGGHTAKEVVSGDTSAKATEQVTDPEELTKFVTNILEKITQGKLTEASTCFNEGYEKFNQDALLQELDTEDGNTVLRSAVVKCQPSDLEFVQKLLGIGSNVNKTNFVNNTPLAVFCARRDITREDEFGPILDELLERASNDNINNSIKIKTLEWVRNRCNNKLKPRGGEECDIIEKNGGFESEEAAIAAAMASSLEDQELAHGGGGAAAPKGDGAALQNTQEEMALNHVIEDHGGEIDAALTTCCGEGDSKNVRKLLDMGALNERILMATLTMSISKSCENADILHLLIGKIKELRFNSNVIGKLFSDAVKYDLKLHEEPRLTKILSEHGLVDPVVDLVDGSIPYLNFVTKEIYAKYGDDPRKLQEIQKEFIEIDPRVELLFDIASHLNEGKEVLNLDFLKRVASYEEFATRKNLTPVSRSVNAANDRLQSLKEIKDLISRDSKEVDESKRVRNNNEYSNKCRVIRDSLMLCSNEESKRVFALVSTQPTEEFPQGQYLPLNEIVEKKDKVLKEISLLIDKAQDHIGRSVKMMAILTYIVRAKSIKECIDGNNEKRLRVTKKYGGEDFAECMYFACIMGDKKLVKYLLEVGASKYKKIGPEDRKENSILLAVSMGNLDLAEILIEDVDLGISGKEILQAAVNSHVERGGNFHMVEWLIYRGLDPNIEFRKDDSWNTDFNKQKKIERLLKVEMLLDQEKTKYQKDTPLEIDFEKKIDGRNLLRIALDSKNYEMAVDLICQANQDGKIDLRDFVAKAKYGMVDEQPIANYPIRPKLAGFFKYVFKNFKDKRGEFFEAMKELNPKIAAAITHLKEAILYDEDWIKKNSAHRENHSVDGNNYADAAGVEEDKDPLVDEGPSEEGSETLRLAKYWAKRGHRANTLTLTKGLARDYSEEDFAKKVDEVCEITVDKKLMIEVKFCKYPGLWCKSADDILTAIGEVSKDIAGEDESDKKAAISAVIRSILLINLSNSEFNVARDILEKCPNESKITKEDYYHLLKYFCLYNNDTKAIYELLSFGNRVAGKVNFAKIRADFLLLAIKNEDIYGIEAILLNGAIHPSYISQKINGKCFLHRILLCKTGGISKKFWIVLDLLRHGADPNVLDENGHDLLRFIELNSRGTDGEYKSFLEKAKDAIAMSIRGTKSSKRTIDALADVNEIDKFGNAQIHRSVIANDCPAILELLRRSPTSLVLRNAEGLTPYELACRHEKYYSKKILTAKMINVVADMELVNKSPGKPKSVAGPPAKAIIDESTEIKGLEKFINDNNEKGVAQKPTEEYFIEAVKCGNEEVMYGLIGGIRDLKGRSNAIGIAYLNNEIFGELCTARDIEPSNLSKAIEILLNRGIDPNHEITVARGELEEKFGALEYVVESSNIVALEAICKNCDPNDLRRRNLLHRVVANPTSKDSVEMVKMLIAHGADVGTQSMRDGEWVSATEFAQRKLSDMIHKHKQNCLRGAITVERAKEDEDEMRNLAEIRGIFFKRLRKIYGKEAEELEKLPKPNPREVERRIEELHELHAKTLERKDLESFLETVDRGNLSEERSKEDYREENVEEIIEPEKDSYKDRPVVDAQERKLNILIRRAETNIAETKTVIDALKESLNRVHSTSAEKSKNDKPAPEKSTNANKKKAAKLPPEALLAMKNTILNNIKINNTKQVEKDLAQFEIDPCEIITTEDFEPTVLHYAAENCNSDMMSLLLRNTKNPDKRDNRNHNALFCAIQAGKIENVHVILGHLQEQGIDLKKYLNRKIDDKGRTVLHEAAKLGNVEIVSLLIDEGANPLKESKSYVRRGVRKSDLQKTPLSTALTFAIKKGKMDNLIEILSAVLDFKDDDVAVKTLEEVKLSNRKDLAQGSGIEKFFKSIIDSQNPKKGRALDYLMAKNPGIAQEIQDLRSPLGKQIREAGANIAKTEEMIEGLIDAIEKEPLNKELWEHVKNDRYYFIKPTIESGADVNYKPKELKGKTILEYATRGNSESSKKTIEALKVEPKANRAPSPSAEDPRAGSVDPEKLEEISH